MEYNAPFVSNAAPRETKGASERQIEFLMSEADMEKWEAQALLREYKAPYLREGVQELRRCTSKTKKSLLLRYLLGRYGWEAEIFPTRERQLGIPRPPLAKKMSKEEVAKNAERLKKMLGGATA